MSSLLCYNCSRANLVLGCVAFSRRLGIADVKIKVQPHSDRGLETAHTCLQSQPSASPGVFRGGIVQVAVVQGRRTRDEPEQEAVCDTKVTIEPVTLMKHQHNKLA